MAGLTGVLGGTFDPPHIGHLILAEEARFNLGLDRVLWVVTSTPPHKPMAPQAPIESRLEMVAEAIRGNSAFEVSRADIDRPAPMYSVGTLAWLRARDPAGRWAYLMGSDSLADLPRWHDPEAFLEACELVGVMVRPGAEMDWEGLAARLPMVRKKVRFFEAPMIGISARDIRRRVAAGLPYRYLVAEGVAEVIRRRGLYGPAGGGG